MSTDRLNLHFLGPIEVSRGGAPIALPPSRKTRALLAWLAVTGRSHRRERLCEMFWDVTDDPRGALRWSLSKVRALDDAAAPRVLADRESVRFVPAGAWVDVIEVKAALAGGVDALPTERLRELIAMFRGPFLEGLDLPDFATWQAWCVAQREEWRAVHERLLRALLERLEEGAPAEAAPVAQALVDVTADPDSARALLERLLARDTRPAPEPRDSAAAGQVVRLCTAPDGARIAYATVGRGPALVKTANWMSHLEYDWKSPIWRHLAHELSRDRTLVRYDQRGNGLSDRRVAEVSQAAFVADFEAVVDAAGLERFALFGVSQGCAVAAEYAARHPERLTHLILYGGFSCGWCFNRGRLHEQWAALDTLIRQGWGQDNPAFRQLFTSLFMPEATPAQMSWFNELQAVSTSAETAARISRALGETDVRALLPGVRVPTLVLHATQDGAVPFGEGRALAAAIPGARFVALESRNHLLLGDEPAWRRFVAEVRTFLAAS